MIDAELKPNTVIIGERNYDAALDLVIAHAQQELLIFDADLQRDAFNSLPRYQLLHDFLSNSSTSQLTIILHHAPFFNTQCPRLLSLLQIYSHKMTVYETNDHAKIAKDCFVIADKTHYVRRFHIDQARFKFALNDVPECANLSMRFDELMDETTDAIAVTQLGL